MITEITILKVYAAFIIGCVFYVIVTNGVGF